ncbi:MAG: hypothetical protein ACAH12_06960 [Methylophilaceae bacterium]
MEIVVETFHNPGEPSSNPIRVRPILGQKFSEQYRVWCSVKVRESKTIGSLFLVNVTLVKQPQGEPYLKIDLNEEWKSLTEEEAKNLIEGNS